MNSVPSVGLPVGAFYHAWTSSFQYFTDCASQPLNSSAMLLVGKESHLFFQLQASQVLCSVYSIELLLLCILDLDQLLVDLLCVDWSVQSREDRSLCWASMQNFCWQAQVWCYRCVLKLQQCLGLSIGCSVYFLECSLDLFNHQLDEPDGLMEVWWRCLMDKVELSGKLSELFAIERRSVGGHNYSWHAFSRKQVSQVHQYLGMVCGCYLVDIWKPAEIICNDKNFVAWIILEVIHTPLFPGSWGDLMWMVGSLVLSMHVRHLFT